MKHGKHSLTITLGKDILLKGRNFLESGDILNIMLNVAVVSLQKELLAYVLLVLVISVP